MTQPTQFLFEPVNRPGYYLVQGTLGLIWLLALILAAMAVMAVGPLVLVGYWVRRKVL